MTPPLVLVEQRGRALVVTLNRPEQANALSQALVEQLGELGRRLHAHSDVRVIILTGAGERNFCAGADLKERQRMSDEDVRRMLRLYRTCLGWIETCKIPTIAAINGAALGGGLELALMCDLRVAVPDAKLGLPETSLGVIPAAGGTQRLPRLIGEARAKELILLCPRIDAAQALHYGLINRVCAPGIEVVSDALDWARPLLEGAPLSARAALTAIDASRDSSLEDGLEAECRAYEACLLSEDRREALRAFAEKRKPNFLGR